MYKVACIQNFAGPNWQENVAICDRLINEAINQEAQFICLPEFFAGVSFPHGKLTPVAFRIEKHPILLHYQELARDKDVALLLGSLGVETDSGKIANRSFFLDNQGEIVASYNKVHLFDVDINSANRVRESDTIAAGEHLALASWNEMNVGMTVCYDLRFAYQYRALAHAGANIFTVPAMFTKFTGSAHWHVLLRARAIECGAFVIAPCQYGKPAGGPESYGHSLIVGPWGEILAEAGEGEDVIVAEINLEEVQRVRKQIPALQHDRAILVSKGVE